MSQHPTPYQPMQPKAATDKLAGAAHTAVNEAAGKLNDATDRAKNLVTDVAEKSSSMMASANDAAHSAVDSAGRQLSDAGNRFAEVAETQKNAGADAVGYAAGKAKQVADQIQGNVPQVADGLRTAANGMERASKQLRETSFSDMGDALADAAKQRPLATVAAAFVAGIVISRLMSN